MKTICLGLANKLQFIAAAESHVIIQHVDYFHVIDGQEAESLRDFLLEHYPVSRSPERAEGPQ